MNKTVETIKTIQAQIATIKGWIESGRAVPAGISLGVHIGHIDPQAENYELNFGFGVTADCDAFLRTLLDIQRGRLAYYRKAAVAELRELEEHADLFLDPKS